MRPCHQVAIELDHLPCMRCEAESNGGDAVAVNREIAVAIEAGRRITNPRAGEHQIIGRFKSIHCHLGTLLVCRHYGAGWGRESQARLCAIGIFGRLVRVSDRGRLASGERR